MTENEYNAHNGENKRAALRSQKACARATQPAATAAGFVLYGGEAAAMARRDLEAAIVHSRKK